MHPGSIGAAEQRLAELRAALAQTGRQLKKARADQQRAQLALAREWQVSPGERRTAVIIYVLADYAAEPAAKFLAGQGRIHRWPDKPERDLCALVESLFVEAHAADAGGLIALTDVENPSDPTAMATATGYVEEWRLYIWAKDLNVSKGVAPSTSSVLERVVATRLANGHAAPYAIGTAAQGASRMWATRFRRRWGGRFGAIREHENVPLDELAAKAV